MTSVTPMTREELLDLAALDAFGLLEPYEAALYTRSFHHAPAAVQDEIKELQARLVSDESLLPDEQPPADLRRRVLAAVAHSIDSESTHLAPIASIGSPRAGTGGAHQSRRPALASGFWRAAAFVLAGGLVVMSYFLADALGRADKLTELVYGLEVREELTEQLGPDWLTFVGHRDCLHRPMSCATDACSGQVGVWVNRDTGEALVFAVGLPRSGAYRVRVVDEHGESATVGTFRGTGNVNALRVDHFAEATGAAVAVTWQIVDANGTVLFATT